LDKEGSEACRTASVVRIFIDFSSLKGASRLVPRAADQWISMPPFTSMTAPVM
jgi:hypothetical protein